MQFTVIGRRWFERINGNTYHSVEVYQDGELLERIPFTYGYGSMWEQNAMEIIKKHNPDIAAATDKHYSLYRLEALGHKVVSSVTDVNRKKDL